MEPRSRTGALVGVGVVLGAALVVAALVVLALQVRVPDGRGGTALACGSAWDAAAGRVGWERWWAADLSQPSGTLARTSACPDAVNRRMVAAGALAVTGSAVLAVSGLLGRRRRTGPRGRAIGAADRLRRLGATATVVGAVATAGGVVALLLVLADPGSVLFLYVDRAVVALAGAALLVAPVGLMVVGRAVTLAGRALSPPEGADGAA